MRSVAQDPCSWRWRSSFGRKYPGQRRSGWSGSSGERRSWGRNKAEAALKWPSGEWRRAGHPMPSPAQ